MKVPGMSIRDNETVTVSNAVNGSKRVRVRQRSPHPSKVHDRKIHPAVLAEAKRRVNNDVSRLTVISETEIRID